MGAARGVITAGSVIASARRSTMRASEIQLANRVTPMVPPRTDAWGSLQRLSPPARGEALDGVAMTAWLREVVDDRVDVDAEHRAASPDGADDDRATDVALAGVADAERTGEEATELSIATRH